MRFRKRLAAAILAIVMIVTSVQVPGGTSYAAESAGGSIESGQEVLEPSAEADSEGGGESADEQGAVSGDEVPPESEARPDESAAAGGDDRAEQETDKSTVSETMTSSDTENNETEQSTAEETGTEQSTAEETGTEETTAEETGTEETTTEEAVTKAADEETVLEAELSGAYQFGGAPSDDGNMASDYDGIELLADSAVEAYLYQQMLKRATPIVVATYSIKKSDVAALVSGVLNEHPDLYFVNKNYKYELEYGSNDKVVELIMTYDTGYDDTAFKESTDEALSYVTDGMSDFEKAAVLHDYLAVNVEYDNALEAYSAYDALVRGVSVCQGYALAYKYLLSKAGIESYMVTSDSMDHAWNMVKLNGKYYHVDVTWDDPTQDIVGRVLHTNLFCTDTNFGKHENWKVTSGSSVVDYKATDGTYDSAFWKDSTAPLVFSGSDCYYVSGSGSLRKAVFSNVTDKGTEVVNIGKWPSSTGGYWTAAYSGLYMINNRLFYNDAGSIYSIKPDGTDKKTEFTADTTGGYSIFGSAYRGGTVFYVLHTSPNLTGKEEILTADIGGVVDEPDPPEETKEGYNVENLPDSVLESYGAKNVLLSSGNTIPKSDGHPVVLMFYNSSNSGTNGVSTLKAIGEHGDYFKTGADRVDFYGIDTNLSATEDSIKNFTVSNDIYRTEVFNWLYIQKSNPYMQGYLNQIKAKSSVTGSKYPILIYIDKNNKIQYATEGNLTAEEIQVNVRQYCGYTQYRITYHMDGGKNNSENPAMYTGGEEVVLKSPYPRAGGYRFMGWYKDQRYTKKVTKIPAGSKNDVTLYAKWGKGPYNVANPSQEYTTLDDTKVSLKADGRPKLLVFFDGRTGWDGDSIFDIMTEALADQSHDLHGVDIYAIETAGLTKTILQGYSKDFAEDIIFCYDTSGANKKYMQAYLDIIGTEELEGDLYCYIDQNNRLQYAVQEMCIVETIMENLQTYCHYPYARYTITYELDGGTNDSSNPSSYHSGMETIVLKAATKEGCSFGGWYADAEFTRKVTDIPKGSTGDITLYAKWKNGLNTENPEYTFTTMDDTTVSSKADGRPKVLFFFNSTCANCQRTNAALSEHIKAFSGADVYAIEATNQLSKDKIATYIEQYGCDEITYCYNKDGKNASIFFNYGLNIAHVGSGESGTAIATPLIIFIDSENRVQHGTAGTRSWTEIFVDLREYCDYDYYFIDYNLDGGKNSSENPEIYKSGADTITLKDPSKAGWRFDGWYSDAEYTQNVTEIPKGSGKDITLYAKWTKTGEGLALENLDRTFTALDDTTFRSTAAEGRPRLLIFFGKGYVKAMQTLASVSKAINDFDGVDIYAIETDQNTKDAVSAFQKTGDFENITVSYDTTSGNRNVLNAYLQATGNQAGIIEYPTICYIDANNCLQWITLGVKETAETIKANLKKYCDYPPDPEGTYYITYELDGGTNHKDNPASYTADTETIVLKDASKAKFIFDGWYKDAQFKERITEIVKGSTGDITLYAKWRADETGRLDIDNPDQTYTGLDDKTLSSAADGKPKLLVFFSTDSTASQNTFTNIKGIIDSLDGIDIYAVEISQALKSAVNTFKNTYGSDGITFAYDDWSKPSNYDKAKAYEDAAGLSGMYSPLICYIDKDNKLQWVTENEQTGDEILENLKKYCNYPPQEEEGTYKITYELDGGTNSKDNPSTYTSETETIVLKDAVKEGCKFDGWYKDGKFLEQVTEIPKGSVGDITLYAKWRVLGYDLPNLDQTYTALDGTKLSSKADGRPKVLIFYIYNSGKVACKNTMMSIRANIDDFSGVDIYAIECNKGTNEKVSEFQSTYGTDKIPFAYDESGTVDKPGMKAYELAATGKNESLYTYPLICYIDSDNRFQLLTIGESSAEDVMTNLQQYCGYVFREGVYNITYVLDGGTNHSGNPGVYTADTETIVLKDASKKGYDFGGWYKDAAFKEQVTEIPKGSTGDITLYAKWIPNGASDVEITVTFVDSSFVYNGREQKPKVKVTTAGPGGKDITLKEGTDYKLSYENNKNAGTAKVIVQGMGEYTGTVEETFVILPAPLVIRAADMVILVGSKIPTEYEYEVEGLQGSDELIKEPILTCGIASTAQEGEYIVTPSGADAGSNYVITYEDGVLIVTTEYILWKVTFDTQGHGKAPAAYTGVRAGATIDSPAEPRAEGYRFGGWFKDSACTKAWNFETDIVESNITLYAKWLYISSDGSFALQEVPDQYYTGKALKPAVSVYDGDTLLKAGKDYQLKYYNNTNANANGVQKTGNGEGSYFNADLPYVEITGKGNYKSTVKVNFNILKVSIGDSSMMPAAGAVLKVNDHYAKSNKALTPSVSLKVGRALKKDKDFTVSIEPIYAFDASGYLILELEKAEIPAGATGEFKLLVKGIGNYEGGIMQQIYVADKDHLMKNAKITLGKNLKNVDYTGKMIRLTPSTKSGDDVFTVQIGKKILNPATDYMVIPSDGSVGKVELVVVGTGDYVGRQTTTFNVKGKAFSNSTVSVSGITDKTYTGAAHTQNNDAVVTYKGASKPLEYGKDYAISYSKNINKGTATMTFIGKPEAGYSGKVKKTFKIGAADINTVERDPSMRSIAVTYAKAGAKPVDEIILTGPTGVRLRNGKDYTLKYKDNKAVTSTATVTVTGKGNYSGNFDVQFRIMKADLSEDRIVVQPAAVAYNEGKADDYEYMPAIKLKDGKSVLKAGKDYDIKYLKNTQADYKNYLAKLAAGRARDEDVPRARITAIDDANYGLASDIKAFDVPLQIYRTKLKKSDLSVQISEVVYTGGQVKPEVTVSCNGNVLREGVDYMLAYGANNKAGKNKGSVTVTGLAPNYGGSVTFKFDINSKVIKY